MRSSSERLSNYAGCATFVFLGVWTFVRMPAVSFFLLPTFLHELFVAIAFLVRDPVRAGAPSIASRITAYAGTFMLVLFFQFARSWNASWLTMNALLEVRAIGILLWLVGAGLSLAAVWSLRHSFSIEPEARRLVTSGPYGYARHPIYALYFLQYAGLWLIYPTGALAAVLGAWFALTFARMHFEERVLAAAFPEYASYQARVGRFAPRLRRRAAAHAPADGPVGREPVAHHA